LELPFQPENLEGTEENKAYSVGGSLAPGVTQSPPARCPQVVHRRAGAPLVLACRDAPQQLRQSGLPALRECLQKKWTQDGLAGR